MCVCVGGGGGGGGLTFKKRPSHHKYKSPIQCVNRILGE